MVATEHIVSAQGGESGTAARRACLFRACGQTLAINLDYLFEVVNEAIVTPLPQAPKGLIGLINLRGEILPVVDLFPWIGEDSCGAPEITTVMILQANDLQCGLRVAAVKDVAEYRELDPADDVILRPGLEGCMRPVRASSFETVSPLEDNLVWWLAASELMQSLATLFCGEPDIGSEQL